MIKKLLFLLILLSVAIAQGQDITETSFLNFNEIKKEVSGQWISSVQQDKDGFIWVASQDGLYKYDGKNFKSYRYNPSDKNSLPANWVHSIHQDQNEAFWLGTQGGGLVKFEEEKSKFTTIDLPSITDSDNTLIVYDAITTSSLDIWVISEDGLYRKSSKGATYINIAKPSTSIQVHELGDGSEIVMFENTLFNFNAITNALEVVLKDIPFGRILVTGKKSIIYRSKGKMFSYDFSGIPKEIQVPDNEYINSISNLQNDKCILVGAHTNYTFDVASKTFEVYNYNIQQFKELGINELFIDTQNLLWIATNKGLFKENLLGKAFIGKIDLHARRLLKDADTLYIGGGKGLHKIVLKEGIQETETLKEARVTSLCKTNYGLWFGDYFGRLFFMDTHKNLKTIDLRHGSKQPLKIYGIVEDKANRIWVSTWRGIYVINANGELIGSYNLKSKNEKTDVKIIKTLSDNDDNLWAITVGDGVYKIPNFSNINYKNNAINHEHYIHNDDIPNSINSDVVMEIHLDSNGDIWIGSDFGINKYSKEKGNFNPLIINGEFFDKKIMAIESDANNLLWISTIADGIYIYNQENKTLFNLTEEDGLASNACLYTSSTIDGDTLYFGTDEGVQIINTSNFTYPKVNEAPIFSEITIQGAHPETLKGNNDIEDSITLRYNQNSFNISLAISDYRFPDKIDYYYKLNETTKFWTKAEGNNINFNNVNFGAYNLLVKAAYQAEDEAPKATLILNVNPPWYKSLLAYVLLFLSLGTLLFYFFQLRYKQKLAFNKLKAVEELDIIKSNLFTNISHELRTPLTLISGPIEHQLSNKYLKIEDREELNMIKQSADRLLNLVNQLMDLALIDSGQLRLKIVKGNLNLFLNQSVTVFQYQANEKNIQIKSDIKALESVWFDRDSLEKIVFNLLSNAIKYGTKSSSIVFNASQLGNNVVLSVINDNNTSDKNLAQLFERFYQNDASTEGVGVGLALVKELVSLNNGTIIANKVDTKKIQFTVTLPIDKAAFHVSEVKEDIFYQDQDDLSKIAPLNDDTVILIVEDDDAIRKFINSIFKKRYHLIEANNGEQGVNMALQHIPDLIISDVMMPIMDGVSLCDNLKNNQLTSHIPIILLTAKVGEDHEISGLKTGADAYITKPFSLEKLKTRVEKLLENRTQLQKHYSNDFNISPEIKITSTETEFLKRLQDTLKIHLTNSGFTSERFAEVMQMSRTQLHRKLKAIVNVTASEFIRKERLKLAIQLLKESDATVAEIAYQIGFNSPSYFIKCFKDLYNCTPNEYLEK